MRIAQNSFKQHFRKRLKQNPSHQKLRNQHRPDVSNSYTARTTCQRARNRGPENLSGSFDHLGLNFKFI